MLSDAFCLSGGSNRRRSAWEAEALVPDFEQRLVTLAERDREDQGAFGELLAADTLKIAQRAEAAKVVPNEKLLISLGAALASLGVLIWMIVAGPGFLGYGAALLWAGNAGAAPLYELRVIPGRRGGAQKFRSADHRPTSRHTDELGSHLCPLREHARSGIRFPCSRSPVPRISSFSSPACPRASNTTSKPGRCIPAISIFA